MKGKLCILVLIAASLWAFGGCGGSGSNDSNLVGTWVHESSSSSGTYIDEYTFNKDGTGVSPSEVYKVDTQEATVVIEKFHWDTRVDGEKRQLRIGWLESDNIKSDEPQWGSWADYRIEFGSELVLG